MCVACLRAWPATRAHARLLPLLAQDEADVNDDEHGPGTSGLETKTAKPGASASAPGLGLLAGGAAAAGRSSPALGKSPSGAVGDDSAPPPPEEDAPSDEDGDGDGDEHEAEGSDNESEPPPLPRAYSRCFFGVQLKWFLFVS